MSGLVGMVVADHAFAAPTIPLDAMRFVGIVVAFQNRDVVFMPDCRPFDGRRPS